MDFSLTEGSYKSITKFSWNDIPNFVVLTGLNGSGKTQILDLIDHHFQIEPNKQNKAVGQKFYGVKTTCSEPYSFNDIIYIQDTWKINNPAPVGSQDIIQVRDQVYNILIDQSSKDNTYKQLALKIAQDLDGAIRKEDIVKHLPSNYKDYISKVTTHEGIAEVFRMYYLRQAEQLLHGDTHDAIQTLAPWEILNNILHDSNFPYRVNKPNSLIDNFELKLISTTDSTVEVSFSDLSSGEKIIISIVIWLYNTKNPLRLPKLLLIDEADAHLHPSLTKIFLNVIENHLVKVHNIRVILTTHSPSTVALASEEAIHAVEKGSHIVRKISKDAAVKLLLSGVPSLSLNHQNRKQIFVESQNDVRAYQVIYEKLTPHLLPDISLSFISSGDSRTDKHGNAISNCHQVKNIVDSLRLAGNNLIYGIIDWDSSNEGSSHIKVIGKSKRYSIENYLFDPILLSALLLREKIISRQSLGLEEDMTYVDFNNFSNERLQSIADKIIDKVHQNSTIDPHPTVPILYVNRKSIQAPQSYLHYNGHNLESIILSTFPHLKGIKRNEEFALKESILSKVVDDLPGFIPLDFLETFIEIQSDS